MTISRLTSVLRPVAIASAGAYSLLSLVACGVHGKVGSSPGSGSNPIPSATTTLQAETGNNTSAADSFVRQTDGNVAAGNISKVSLRSLLPPGSTTKIFVTLMGWFGKPDHESVGYRSDDPAQVHGQVEDMMSRGVDGAIEAWYGPANTVIEHSTQLLKSEAETRAGQFQFAIMEDVGALGKAAKANQCDVTDQMISDLNYVASQYESSPAYLHMNGRPVVLFFNVDAYFIDWSRVISSISGNPLLIFEGTSGLTRKLSDGGFSWVFVNSNNPFDPQLTAQDAFYTEAQNAPGRIAFGSVYKGFNDTLAAWTTNRVIQQQCGRTFLQTFGEVGKFFSGNNQLPGVQIATWNDYEEGTAIEPGIDNCIYLTPSQSGTSIQWGVNGGDESTIDHYTVFLTTDGTNLSKLAEVPAGTRTYDMSRFSLSPVTYWIYVKAMGKPSFQNKMSPAIAYHPGDQAPDIQLKVSQSGSLTYTASTTGSAGNIAKSQIDFGDGTVASATSASHTYAKVGTYLITAAVYDSAGASSVAAQQISAKPSSDGISILTPANGSTVNWPTVLQASGNTGTPVSAMRAMIDGKQAYAANGDTLITNLKVYTGSHQITVQSLDATGTPTASRSVTVDAEPNDIPPVANVTIRALPNISATTVLACTATSFDTDGFVNSYNLKFSDGSPFTSPGVVRTFSAPGTYDATATVLDQYGASDSTSVSFNAGTGTAARVHITPQQQPAQDEQPMQPINPP